MTNSLHSFNELNHLGLIDNDRILRWPEVHSKTGLSRPHVHKLIAAGRFPSPIKLGVRSSGWLCSEITSWLEQRIAESRPTSPAAA